VPILYIIGATIILAVLFIYQTATTWPGLIIVITGIPVYFIWSKLGTPMAEEGSISEAAAKAEGEY
jgi:APA family basic amino acid/polyamine antiporter